MWLSMGTVDAAEVPTEEGWLDEGWRPRQLVFELSSTVIISAIYVRPKKQNCMSRGGKAYGCKRTGPRNLRC